MVSRLTLLGFGILAWSGVIGLCALTLAGTQLAFPTACTAALGATGGLATAIVGAARHDSI